MPAAATFLSGGAEFRMAGGIGARKVLHEQPAAKQKQYRQYRNQEINHAVSPVRRSP